MSTQPSTPTMQSAGPLQKLETRLQAAAHKLDGEKHVDPIRDSTAAGNHPQAPDSMSISAKKHTKAPQVDLDPNFHERRRQAALRIQIDLNTPTADFPSPGLCNLRRRGAVRGYSGSGTPRSLPGTPRSKMFVDNDREPSKKELSRRPESPAS